MYCSQADLEQRFGQEEILQLADRDNDGSIDAIVIDTAIADAAGEINGYLQGRYRLPFATVPTVLKRIACDIARYFLYDDKATDQVRQRYDDAIKFLMGAAKGDISLGLDDDNNTADSTADTAMGFSGRNDWRGGSF